ncbi:MAG: XRE family transcriptional regulator [Oscillospiraceae bacterium]|nr:XRE family transcriptional regulator [Oscillospiraceae bacterium]
MNYELRHFDTPLLRFSATEDSNNPEVEILWKNAEKEYLLPLDLVVSGDGVAKWLKRRTIPKNRAYVHSFLSRCGLNLNRPISIIKVSKGLSLNDCYWVVEEDFDGSFDKYNLYDNNFSQVLALIAFTGYGSSIRTSMASCPEFTTNGMLPKCWRRQNGQVKLYKGGTTGASNTGNEPYSEFYAYQIAKAMDVNAIPYSLSKWKGVLCSTCDLFTSKERSFIPVGRIVATGGMEAVRKYYKSLGEEFTKSLDDMIVLDSLICNTDRHFGNFGFLIDNKTNKIIAPAPLFDHGNALFNYAGKNDIVSEESLRRYVDTLLPCVYDDFVSEARAVLTLEHRESLRHLLDFSFKKHSRYNLPSGRLKLIEKQIRLRAKELLDK